MTKEEVWQMAAKLLVMQYSEFLKLSLADAIQRFGWDDTCPQCGKGFRNSPLLDGKRFCSIGCSARASFGCRTDAEVDAEDATERAERLEDAYAEFWEEC